MGVWETTLNDGSQVTDQSRTCNGNLNLNRWEAISFSNLPVNRKYVPAHLVCVTICLELEMNLKVKVDSGSG